MTALHVRRLEARYHLPPSARDQRPRLEAVLRAMLEEPLERAFERRGLSSYEQVCIRRLHVPVELRLALADAALAADWSVALSEVIADARDGHGGRDVVRYATPMHALVDMATGVAADRYEHAWAWRMSGVWRGSDAPSSREAIGELVEVLLGNPVRIVPLLTALTNGGVPRPVFAALWRRIPPAQWVALAKTAMVANGGPATAIGDAAAAGIAEVGDEVRRILFRSAIGRAVIVSAGDALQDASLELRRAVAILVVLETDPGAVTSAARVRSLVAGVSDALHPAARGEQDGGIVARARQRSTPADDDEPAAVSQLARTEHGGLLFLLNLFGVLDLPAAIDRARGARPFRWMLHQLAMSLAAMGPRDPAALAFAGLLPDAIPPSDDVPPPTEADRLALDDLARLLAAAVDARIDMRPSLPFICARAADVVADPGWIALRFASRDVETSIRRAGLDLNPGYLPWLGAVVMFSYE